MQKLQQAFHQLHETTYGHQLTMPVELVNLRMSVQGEAPPFSLPFISHQRVVHEEKWVNCYTGGMDVSSQPVRLYQREQLSCAEKITGPALVLEKNSTTLIEPGWCCVVDGWGNLLLKKVVSL